MNQELFQPEYPDNPQKQMAYTHYVVKANTADSAAIAAKVPVETIRQWRRTDDWDKARRDICRAARTAAGERLGLLMAEKAQPMFQRFTDLHGTLLAEFSKTMNRIAEATADPDSDAPACTPKELATLSRALNAAFGTGREMLEMAGVRVQPDDEEAKQSTAPVQVNILNALRDAAEQQPDPLDNARRVETCQDSPSIEETG